MCADGLDQGLGPSLGTTNEDSCPHRGRMHSPPPPETEREGAADGGRRARGVAAAAVMCCSPVSGHSPLGSPSSIVQRTQRGDSFLCDISITLTGIHSKRCRHVSRVSTLHKGTWGRVQGAKPTAGKARSRQSPQQARPTGGKARSRQGPQEARPPPLACALPSAPDGLPNENSCI